MSTTIDTRLERRIEANPRGLTIIETIRGDMIQAALTPDEARLVAAALTADQGGQWTREIQGALWAAIRDELRREYPSSTDYDHRKLDIAASASVDAVIETLDAHHPRPGRDFSGVDWKAMYDQARRERDAAVERAEQAVERGDNWEQRAHDWMKLAEKRGAVSRADIEKALRECTNDVFASHAYPHMADAVCALFCIEAEQAVDPVEAKARELHEVASPAPYWTWEVLVENAKEPYRRIARHVLGQEADHA